MVASAGASVLQSQVNWLGRLEQPPGPQLLHVALHSTSTCFWLATKRSLFDFRRKERASGCERKKRRPLVV